MLLTSVSVILQSLGENEVVIVENEFRVVGYGDIIWVDVDGRLMLASTMRLVLSPI